MKQFLTFLILAVLVVGIVWGSNYEHHYTMEDCVVYQSNDGWASIVDSRGCTWDIEDKTLKENDVVSVKFFDNHTPNDITDDKIVEINK